MPHFKFPEDARWKPRYSTSPLILTPHSADPAVVPVPYENFRTDGEKVAIFARTFLRGIEGFRAGLPVELTDWQKCVTNNVFERTPLGLLRYREYLVMIPRKNGKTFLAALYVLYHLVMGPDFAEIYSAAKDRPQAKLVFAMVQAWISYSPILKKLLKVVESKNKVINTKTGAFYEALSADAGGAHGRNPYFVVADEIHAWESAHSSDRAEKFWAALTTGQGARTESQVLVISTAGENVNNSLLGRIYKAAIEVAEGLVINDQSGCAIWQADDDDDPLDESTWFKANPNLAEGLFSLDWLRFRMQRAISTNIVEFLQFHLNIWARLSGESYISSHHWNNALLEEGDIPLGSKITVGFDGSQTDDCTVIVIMDTDENNAVFMPYKIWEKDGSPDWSVKRDEVEEAMKQLHEDYQVELVWADNSYFVPDVKRWADEYNWNVDAIPNTHDRMMPMGNQFLQDLIEGEIFHNGDGRMTLHVMNAVRKENGAYGKEKRGSRNKIDLLAGAVMANGARRFLAGRGEPQEWMVLR